MKGDSAGSERRTYPRRSIIWRGEIRAGSFTFPCSVWNLSLVGTRVRLDLPLRTGADVVLTLQQSGALAAQVVWQRGDVMGLEFVLDPEEVRTLFAPELVDRLGLDVSEAAGED